MDRQSTPTSTPEEEELYIDEETYAHLSDECSLKMDDSFGTKRTEKPAALIDNQSQSDPVEKKASDGQQQSDSATPVASSSSLHMHSNDKFDVAASTSSTFFDQARRGSLNRRSTESRMQTRSKLCQTEWSWEEDLKLLALYSESSFFSELLSEMNDEAELKACLAAKASGRSTDKSPCRGIQLRTGSAAGDDDFLVTGWDNGTDAHMEGSDESWLARFIKTLSSVGPPQILQYKKESVFPSTACPSTLKPQTMASYGSLDEELQNYIFQLDKAARRAIVARGSTAICPFCGKEARVNPYCCDAYQRHLEILRKSELDEYLTGKSSIDFKSRLLHGLKKARKGGSTSDGSHLRSAKKKKQLLDPMLPHSKSSQAKQSGQFKSVHEKETGQAKSTKEKPTGTKDKDESRDKGQSSSRLVRGASPSMVKDLMGRPMHLAPSRNPAGPSTSLYQQSGGRQQKTISYQLSSQKCLDDGWTLSFSPSPVDSELTEDYDDLIQISRLNGSDTLFVRTYDNGNIFAVIFPDGSGTIFHPNGKVAISAVLVDEGLYTYIVQDDSDESKILAVFQPDGHAGIYFPDGRLRICLSPTGGLEIGRHGAKKRKWLWCDMYDQQQRAPLQPITVGITPECGIRIMSQGNITVTYNNNCRNIKLHVGTTLMLSDSQFRQTARKDWFDQAEQFRKETKLRVATLIDKILTTLEFPKSLKVDNIPRPLHLLNSTQQKKYARSQATT